MKKATCKSCKKKFQIKEIYTIQQFQYRKEPTYKWSLEFMGKLGIGEWDSLCESCVKAFAKKSIESWKNLKKENII